MGKPAATSRAVPLLTRSIPSILEIRQRIDAEGHPELHSFYLHVLPLLKGLGVDAFRRSSQKFEARQLVLSSDLQRLELWTSTGGSAAPPAASGSAPAVNATLARSRPRLAESFLR